MFKKLFNKITTPVLPATHNLASQSNYTYTINTLAPNAGLGHVTIANPVTAGGGVHSYGTITAIGGGGGSGFSTFNSTPATHIVTFSNPTTSHEIVRLNVDGSVTWANGIDIDAAAAAFGSSISMGAEMRAGISKTVKLKMRDSVFEDLINIAKEKGSLTAEDLTYLLEASKIVEKLKGGN